ncbi:hypothetical protein FisN_5Hh492 [Fistulifera solaris]|jgi:SAM-dependent methyltransferase|uniref:Methyltransferase type 12 domain-containing protein n=1 Tax=Fistulifera solaris TaxID=1519565 RepID=A0A1Z5JTA0_FISSO|nr:hypothetical protein FisN_5Hh492 [Fistulifera solaris]|eukprot:GAX17106.1 hypothetical protein FisN_5Hh492 [Fistulifera solaris]
MEPASSLRAQPQVREQESTVMLRGREKRRHLAASAIDLRDPFELISLAVRFDESTENESLLRTPLERGSFYDTQQFVEVLEFLREQTKPHSKRTQQSPFLEKNRLLAVTPIILSGVLSTIQSQRELSDKCPYSMSLSSELVTACQTMRHAALSRLRTKKQRGRTQRVIIPFFCVTVLISIYVGSLLEMKELVSKLGFVDSCMEAGLNAENATNEHYHKVCRISDAYLWDQYKAYSLKLEGSCSIGKHLCYHNLLRDRYREAPFSMHASLSQELITLEEMESSSFSELIAGSSKRTRTKEKTDISWLGDTNVNRALAEALREYLPANTHLSVLDVGCGVGGTLYPLLSTYASTAETNRNFRYHGMSLSGAEINFARRLASYHDITADVAVFEKKNYDAPLPSATFTAVLAVESLSYSPDIKATLSNLLKSVQRGGLLIIVDKVIAAKAQQSSAGADPQFQISSISHTQWMTAIKHIGCQLELARDLSLEYEVLSNERFDQFSVYWHYRIPFLWASKSSAGRRVVELTEDLVTVVREKAQRREAFRTAGATYNMYICRKL